MKTRIPSIMFSARFLIPILLAVLLATACAPAPATQPPIASGVDEMPQPVVIEPTATSVSSVEEMQPAAVDPTATVPSGAVETPQPVATSRGPNLEATDPTTVSLNSGGLQFVEFFRFT